MLYVVIIPYIFYEWNCVLSQSSIFQKYLNLSLETVFSSAAANAMHLYAGNAYPFISGKASCFHQVQKHSS